MVHLGRWSLYEVKISLWVVIWDPNKATDIGEWWICGRGRLERFRTSYTCKKFYSKTSCMNLALPLQIDFYYFWNGTYRVLENSSYLPLVLLVNYYITTDSEMYLIFIKRIIILYWLDRVFFSQ